MGSLSLPAAPAAEMLQRRGGLLRPADGDASKQAPTPLQVFTCFAQLPPELRQLIWDFAMPHEVPELHVLQAHKIGPPTPLPSPVLSPAPTETGMDPVQEDGGIELARITSSSPPSMPSFPTVYTAYPVLMHVNCEARAFATSRINLRHNPKVDVGTEVDCGCMVPYRAFRSDLDVLYLSWFSIMAFFRRPEFFFGKEFVSSLRHIAVDVVVTTNAHRLVEIFRHLPKLESLHIVFGTSIGPFWANSVLRLKRPVGRCALRPFLAEERRAIIKGGPMTRPRSLDWYLKYAHGEAQYETKMMLVLTGDDDSTKKIGVWDGEKETLKLRVEAQVLVQFGPSAKGQPDWAEMGKDNLTDLVSGMAFGLGMR